MELDPAGRHVVVTGGSRGLGRHLVQAALDAGYCVSTCSRRPTEFTKSLAGTAAFLHAEADLADADATAGFLAAAEEQFGIPYGLVNCAGVAVDGVLATMPPDAIERVVAINLTGTLRLTRLVVRRMLVRREPASIVNVSSIIGLRGYRGLAAYAATKAGLDASSRALARELGERRIRVNSIAPGYLDTEMTGKLGPRELRQIVARTPLGRLGTPADVVGPMLFLLSDASAFVTGQVLVVDGGITA